MGLTQLEEDTRKQYHTLFVQVEAMVMELNQYAHEAGMSGFSRVSQQLIDTLGHGKASSHLLFQIRSLILLATMDPEFAQDARELLDEIETAVYQADKLISDYVEQGGSI